MQGGVVPNNEKLVRFAEQKLLGGDYTSFAELSRDDKRSAAIAILASRCALNISSVW